MVTRLDSGIVAEFCIMQYKKLTTACFPKYSKLGRYISGGTEWQCWNRSGRKVVLKVVKKFTGKRGRRMERVPDQSELQNEFKISKLTYTVTLCLEGGRERQRQKDRERDREREKNMKWKEST